MPLLPDRASRYKDPDVENTGRKAFFSGVLLLTAANLLVKAIGVLFKIPLQHAIGDEGMGYFNSAYTLYTWFYMIATAGIPVSVSILVSESHARGNRRQTNRIFCVSVWLLLLIGLFTTMLLLVGAAPFARLIGAEQSWRCIVAVAPTLFFICISSAIRGYFQGFQNMLPTAVSQVLEAAGKLAVGMLLAFWALRRGYSAPFVAAYAGLGITVGAAAGMVFLLGAKLFSGEKCRPEKRDGAYSPVLRRLLRIAVPVTLSSSVMSLTNLIDLTVVIRRLEQIGCTEQAAMTLYGNYTTLVVPMFNLPPILVYPIAYAIVPVISGALARGERAGLVRVTGSAVRLTMILSLPCTVGLAALAYPILSLLYAEQSAAMGAPLLVLLAPSVFLLCMLAVTNAALQAMGNVKMPILAMIAGAAVKLAVSYSLIGLPGIGIYGTPVGTFLCYLTATAMNVYVLTRSTGVLFAAPRDWMKPLFAALLCVAAAFVCYTVFSPVLGYRAATLTGIAVAVPVYAVALLVLRGVTEEELILAPRGAQMVRMLKKVKLLK